MNYKYYHQIPPDCVIKLEFEETVYTYCIVLEKNDRFIKFQEVYTKINNKQYIKDIRFTENVNNEIKYFKIYLENISISDFQSQYPEIFI